MKLRVTPESKLQVNDVREICDSKRSPVISLKDRLYPGKTGYIFVQEIFDLLYYHHKYSLDTLSPSILSLIPPTSRGPRNLVFLVSLTSFPPSRPL